MEEDEVLLKVELLEIPRVETRDNKRLKTREAGTQLGKSGTQLGKMKIFHRDSMGIESFVYILGDAGNFSWQNWYDPF